MRARVISPERLDSLPPDAPEALGSRRDLARINAVMGTPRAAARLLGSPAPRRVLEIGAGDGSFLLRTLRRVDHPIEVSRATLLDRQDTFSPNVIGHYGRINWGVETVVADAFEHLNEPRTGPFDAIVANLFLHHFEDDRLAELLRLIAAKTERFVAIEPRRSTTALAGTAFLGLLGCNSVTRHDAKVSVRAGFVGSELSRLWPTREGWALKERTSGAFGHSFRAVKIPVLAGSVASRENLSPEESLASGRRS